MARPRFQLLPAARVQTRLSGDHAPPPARDPDGAVLWRLLGANNFELGRSVEPFASTEAAYADIAALVDDLASLEEELVPESPGRWRWRLLRADASTPAAASSRAFTSEREARDNLAQFVDHVGDAISVPAPRPAAEMDLHDDVAVTP